MGLTSHPGCRTQDLLEIPMDFLFPNPHDLLTVHQRYPGPHATLNAKYLAQFPGMYLNICSPEEMTIQSPRGKGVMHGTEYPRTYSMDLPGKEVSFLGSLLFALLWSFLALRKGAGQRAQDFRSHNLTHSGSRFHDRDSGRGDKCLSLHNNPLTPPS